MSQIGRLWSQREGTRAAQLLHCTEQTPENFFRNHSFSIKFSSGALAGGNRDNPCQVICKIISFLFLWVPGVNRNLVPALGVKSKKKRDRESAPLGEVLFPRAGVISTFLWCGFREWERRKLNETPHWEGRRKSWFLLFPPPLNVLAFPFMSCFR